MIISSYKDILRTESELDSLLSSLSIPIKPYDRIHQAYFLIKGLNDVLASPTDKKKYLDFNNKNGECFFSLVELLELKHILGSIKQWDKKIVKDKLRKILDGTLLPSGESSKNSYARNTMFELSLASDLAKRQYNVVLGNPNPDIKVILGNKIYIIECKRTFSDKNIGKLISDTKIQLVKELNRNKDNRFGIIALSLSRIYVEGKNLLNSFSENSALLFLSKTFESFIDSNRNLWGGIKDRRVLAIILHISCPVGFVDGAPFSWARYMGVNNIHIDDNNFRTFEKDFDRLKMVVA